MVRYVNSGIILSLFIWISVTRGQLKFSVKEEQESGTFVGTVDGINGDYTLTDTPYFELNNGNILTKQKIDRESLVNNVIKITVVSDDPSKVPIEISVTVLDVNDHDPQFPTASLTLNLTEGSSTAKYILPLAEDDDDGKNADIVSYEIISGDTDVFQLSFDSRTDRSVLYLKVLKPLNRENVDRYELTISAEDGGDESRRGYLRIVVNVQDINDNAPIFSKKEYKRKQSEDTTVGSALFTIFANDSDTGQNGRISYDITKQTVPGTFEINSATGQISLHKPLDYEGIKTHFLEVTATDGGTPSMTNDAFITIDVTNVDDNDPEISFWYDPPSASIASINERVDIGSLVAIVSVSDPDEPQIKDAITMNIVSGNERERFELVKLSVPNLAKIQVANNDSLGDQLSYNLTIRANDPQPESERFSLASMMILVNSGENNPPKFELAVYKVTISELAPIGSIVTSVHAIDIDTGLNGRLAYSIEAGNGLGWFEIGTSTGLVTTSERLRFEQVRSTNGSLTLRVVSKDETATPLQDSTEIEITILDENDNYPVFTEESYKFEIDENTVGQIGQVKATDEDFGVNGDVSYKLENINVGISQVLSNVKALFRVDAETGYITVVQKLNREDVDKYVLRISASDRAENSLTSYVDVTIDVLDANDNVPIFYPANYYVNLDFGTKPGAKIVTVEATDLDILDEGHLTYHFADDTSTKTQYYNIDANTGAISLARSMNRVGVNDIITVFALDLNDKASSVNATVSVFVTSSDLSDNFLYSEYSFYVLENAHSGYNIGKFELASPSSSSNFYISDGNKDALFQLDPGSGVLTVVNSTLLDAERSSSYNLTITAEIGDVLPSKIAGYITTTCLVNLVDVNDNYPVFSSLANTAKQVEEHRFSDDVTVELSNEFVSVLVYNAEAIDSDKTNCNVRYSLLSSYPNIWIDVKTGIVTLKPLMTSSSFCEEEDLNFVSEITVCDQGSPQLCVVLDLNVTVVLLDELYEKPLQNIFVTLPENTPVNYQISKYNFISPLDSNVTYFMDPLSQFQSFPGGDVLLVKDLNYETAQGYETAVERTVTHHEYSWQQNSRVSVTATDVNDNSPKTAQKDHTFTVDENAKPGYYIGSVQASDADSGIRSSLVYQIKDENMDKNSLSITDLFHCERRTGRLFVSQTPDRNLLKALNLKNGEIHLYVNILDQNGFNASNSFVKTSTVPVKIYVEFENRFALRFVSHFYFADVMENYNVSNVFQVSTTDGDNMWDVKDVYYEIYDAVSRNTDIPFSVTNNGIVQLKQGVGMLDREEKEFYQLTLKASYEDGSETAFAVGFIRILDIKDAPPVFTNKNFNFAISESSPTMSVVGRVEARDGDIVTEDTRITYGLAPENGKFGIDTATGYLFLREKVDYEIKQEYNLTVTATDESNQTASTYVVISVIDENDNNPQFTDKSARTISDGFYGDAVEIATVKATDLDSGSYGEERYSDTNDNSPKFTIPSSYILSPKLSTQVGHKILKISAIDDDVGDNGEVIISIPTSDEDTPDIFAIDKDDYLVVASPIPSEPLVHQVKLIATDKGSPSRSTEMMFYVIVVDESQNNARSQAASSEIEISENSRPGSYVTTISIASVRNSITRYYITSSTVNGIEDEGVFDIDQISGDISQTEELSGKGGKEYELDVIAVDEGSTSKNPRVSRKKVSISIKDENDHVPVFAEATQHVSVSESTAPGARIATLVAKDDDVNDDVTYYGQGSTDFDVNPKTGEITIGENGLDRERSAAYSLTIIADDGLHRSSTELRLTIDDVNDSPPKFSSATICFDILENSPYGTVVGQIHATDEDLDPSITYSFVDGSSYSNAFAINKSLGFLTFVMTSSLDREIEDVYVMGVRATDEGGLFSDVRVFIYVTDANDNPPVFLTTGSDVISISENVKVGSLIETFGAKDVDIGPNGEVDYTIVSGDPNEYFRIGSSTGEIRTNLELDHEQQDSFNLTVIAWNKYAKNPDQAIAYKSLTVNILDENDNSPTLVLPPVVHLNEDAKPGDIVFPVNVVDLDTLNVGDNLIALVQQSPDHGIFQLNAGNTVVYNADRLDFESTEEYNLTLIVYDRDVPEFSNTANVIIRIVDVNEHAPVFAEAKYTPKLIENSALGSFVIKVNADDADSGYNGDVRYKLVPSTNSSYFYINQFSGEIFVANFVDHESASELSFEVQAYDDGPNQLYSTVSVAVEIQDENDCSPVVEPSFAIVHVRENMFDKTKSLLKLTATDSDSGDFGIADIRSTVVSNPNTDAFSLSFNLDGTRDLTLAKPLDREISSRYELTVTAADRGLPPIKSTATILVIVDDVNDELPEFEQFEYHATISETATPGSRVTNVIATDGDDSIITYTMDEVSEMLLFYINPTTGEVFTRDFLDRENVDFYNLTILATDGKDIDGVQNTVSVFLFVTIRDVNDNPPTFEDNEIVVYVNPTESIGTVTILDAVDPDEGENGRIAYRMDGNPKFAIDSDTGELRALKKLTSVNVLKIYATDNGAESKSTSVNVTVYLTGVSESKPTMTHDVTNPILISESTETNSLLGTFKATSTRRNAGSIKFYIKGDRYGWFSLDENSGRLRTKKILDREIASEVTLWIEAQDSGTPPLSTFEKIEIEIEDTNDNAPLFELDSYVGHVEEDKTETIFKISASDSDEGNNGKVSYSIIDKLSENPKKFIIDQRTGDIGNTQTLDREIKSSYKLIVRATDSGSPPLHRDVIVRILVDDVNDNRPVFTSLFSATIKEDADVGDYVLQVTSTDSDLIVNHTYALTENAGDFFSIDSEGVITVAKKLNREDIETHTLEVQCSDDGWKIHTSVIITVGDVNDNAPEFWSSRREASVSVDSGVGTIVMSLNATDHDDGLNGKISYRIIGDNEYFSVNQLGEVITTRELGCDSGMNDCLTQYSFTVLACDSGIPNSLCGSCSVKISVKSVNSNLPKFEEANVKLALLQSTTPGTKIYALSATDDDIGTVIKYHIQDGGAASYFTVDSDDNIVLNKTVSRFNVGQMLSITVQATDDGIPSKSTTMNVNFEITDFNLHRPVFIKSSYIAASVPESSSIGHVIIQVQANDSDAGLNGEVMYAITEGNSDNKFSIGKNTGIIELASVLNYEITKQYEVVVTASDSAVNKLTSTVNVRIPVEDVNDNSPHFNSSYFEIRVKESMTTGHTISTVTAKDDDEGQNALVTYSLDDDTVFDVRSLTGDVYLNTKLDFERQNFYTIKIIAENKGSDKADEAELRITVLGANEFPPVFLQSSYEFNLPVSSKPGTVLGFVNATDEDFGEDGIVEYILLPFQSKDFRIDRYSGIVIVQDSSSYSVGDVINFTIVAKNPTWSSEACLYDEASLRINVISNECNETYCENGGVCSDSRTSVLCSCLPGFTGKHCETDINECAVDPCVHGSCMDGINEYTCTCNAGYTGKDCDAIIDYCEGRPCQNGGNCTNNPTSFTCACPFGTTGPTCNIQSINFPAQSYMVVNGSSTRMSFEFSTVSAASLLFYSPLSNLPYVVFEIIDGKLQMRVRESKTTAPMQLNLDKVVNDGVWHTIDITIQKSTVTLLLDDCSSTTANYYIATSDLNGVIDFSVTTIVMGGIRDVDDLKTGLLTSHDFVGCIRSLTVNSSNIQSSVSPEIIEKFLISDGCQRSDLASTCSENICQNSGRCTDLWSDVQCTCNDGWTGKKCETEKTGQTLTGESFVSISFTESYLRDALLTESNSGSNQRKRRNVGGTFSSFEIRFRTREENAVVVVIVNEDETSFGALFMLNGKLHYRHSTSDGNIEIRATDDIIADGSWHIAKVEITNVDDVTADVTFTVDSSSERKSFKRASNVIDDFTNPILVKNIFIGGLRDSSSVTIPSLKLFKGCLDHFKMDDVTYPLDPEVTSYAISLTVNGGQITSGCDGAGLTCDDVTCENGKTCVPDDGQISKCVCMEGYTDSNGACALVSTAGLDWWIIVIIVILSILIVVGILIGAVCYRRKYGRKAVKTGNGNPAYEFQTRKKHVTPDIVPNDVTIYDAAEDTKEELSTELTIVNTSSLSNGTSISRENIITEKDKRLNGHGFRRQQYASQTTDGRQSATELTNYVVPNVTQQRPASAQAKLAPPIVPSETSVVTSQPSLKQNKFHINQTRTLPRKIPNGSMEYLIGNKQSTPSKTYRNTSSLSSAPRSYRERKRQRRSDTLEGLMRELSDVVGLTNEEWDLLHAGARALGSTPGELLYRNGSSVSTSSLTDMSLHSRTTTSSVRVRNFVRSTSPPKELSVQDLIPGVVLNDSRKNIPLSSSKHGNMGDSFETLAVLGPFEFPPPSESDTTETTTSPSDDDVWESTSNSTAPSTIRKVDSPANSSRDGSNRSGQLDLNFPSNLEEYFTSLVDVFDDISGLKSDDVHSEERRPERRPSVMPSFVGHEISLWSEIEALSGRPLKRPTYKAENLYQSSPSEGRVTPAGRKSKEGSRVGSPASVKMETTSGRDSRTSQRSRKKSDERVDAERQERRRRRSGSGSSSNKSAHLKAEFVKYV